MDWHAIFSQCLQQGLGPTAIVYCLAAIGLNVHFGYTGLLNFGQAGFMAVGGYAHGLDRRHLGPAVLARHRSSACCSAVVLALLLGVPTLRLRADYLAIVTIAAAEIIRQTRRLGQPARSTSAARTACSSSAARFAGPEPAPRAGSASRAGHLAAVRLLGADWSAGSSWRSAA